MVFFWSWELWAKMAFALGSSITVVLALASTVKYFRTRQTRREAQVFPEIHLETGEMIEVDTRLANEIPFGIRAMRQEPDVEGVWNSRTTTPFHTPLHSPRRMSRESSPLRNAFDKLTHSRRGSALSSISRLDIEGPDQSERLVTDNVTTNSTEHHSPEIDIYTRRASTTHTRNSSVVTTATCDTGSSVWISRNLDSKHRISEQQVPTPIHIATTSGTSDTALTEVPAQLFSPSKCVIIAGTDSDRREAINKPFGKGRTMIIRGQPCEETARLIRTPSTLRNLEVLDRMEAHRRFHAAESGQLRPRIRRTTTSVIVPERTPLVSEIDRYDDVGPRSVSWPMTNEDIVISINMAQKPERRVSPPVVPFRACVEVHPPPKPPPSAWTDKTEERLAEVLEIKSKTRILIATSGGPELPECSASSHSGSDQSVIFHVNESPEMNRSSKTFSTVSSETQSQVGDLSQWSKPLQHRSNERKRPAKLQKRNRSQSPGNKSYTVNRHPEKENSHIIIC